MTNAKILIEGDKSGALTKEFYRRHTGSEWAMKEGADILELEVALSGENLEGAMYWKLLDLPDSDPPSYELKGAFNSLKAVGVAKGVFRNYVPDCDRPRTVTYLELA